MTTMRALFGILAGLFSCLPTVRADARAPLSPEAANHFEEQVRPVLMDSCSGCHDPDDPDNHIPFLKSRIADDVANARGLWSSVAEQLRNRTMPPADEPQPSEADRIRIAEWIAETLRATACQEGEYAGTVTTRRLNRREYDHTVRDLLGVEMDFSANFPVDGSGGEGFDNNGETLFLPPILMERYLEAAADILNKAIITPPLSKTFTTADMLPEPQNDSNDKVRVIGLKQNATVLLTVYRAGEFRIRFSVRGKANEDNTAVLRVDRIPAEKFRWRERERPKLQSHDSVVRLARGVHALDIRNAGESPLELAELAIVEDRQTPTDEQRASHRLIFGRHSETTSENPSAEAETVLRRFVRRAFRRPVHEEEVTRLLTLYQRGIDRGDPHEVAIQLTLKAVLVSPHFLFRVEGEPTSPKSEPISDHELAVRLSYFLWESMPDNKLGRLADANRLHKRDILLAQVDRMLADPKASAFAESFVGQWLGTKEVGGRVAPDTGVFRDQFTTELLLDLQEEPVHTFEYMLRENRSLLELLDADYAVVNRRLAAHYGFTKDKNAKKNNGNPWSSNPRRGSGGPFEVVQVPDDRRGGVLGMGAVHMLTSYPQRTSPVLRGGWVLETLLGIRVPSPPPDVPELKRSKSSKQSLREQLATHRDHSACAACHNLMDPVGFALENFDVLGRWREKDGKVPIDASATLPTGEKISGPAELRKALLVRQDEYLRQVTKKMLGFALGRSLTDADDCTINRITTAVQKDDNRVRTLIREIVLSTPFRMRQQPESVEAAP